MTEKIKVLAVDDQDINLRLLTIMLKDADFEILLADDEEGVMTVLQAHPDISIILLDRMMYEADGIEAVKRLKQLPAYKHIPIIMITSSWSPKMETEAKAAGAYAYLPKPYDKAKILGAIGAALKDLAPNR